ncbi:hypothetical protein SAMN05216525_12138 [Bradyrhizobium sp. Gha]|nr:hypothetical protein SAMN05216525_12138 [Bradyrhizobium sp. Gha]
MKSIQLAMLVTALTVFAGEAHAAGGCGEGCYRTSGGACVVDGWGTGAKVRNECPATSRPRPPCGGRDFIWDRGKQACFQNNRDWY